MKFTTNHTATRGLLLGLSLLVVSLILWNTYQFFQVFKQEERLKMELWAKAQTTIENADLETEDIDLPLEIIKNNTSIPLVLTNEKKEILNYSNVAPEVAQDSLQLQKFLKKISAENPPIRFVVSEQNVQYLYYGNSPLIQKLKYYPIALLSIILLFILLIYNYYNTTKIAGQNRLWAGMAKETAHQIGTPLSSLIGWLEILKQENIEASTVEEIEKDITRLQVIADRFSKIGSEPTLEKIDLVASTKETIDYLQPRLSKQVQLITNFPNETLWVAINPALHSWTMENLYKNAVDAMRGKGILQVDVHLQEKMVQIFVSDTGKGIPKNQFKQIFDPGFTTKKRGWGLGLSLTKRIVETYHKGKIRVYQSEVNKGATMLLELPLA